MRRPSRPSWAGYPLPQYTQCSTTGVPGGKPDLQTSNFEIIRISHSQYRICEIRGQWLNCSQIHTEIVGLGCGREGKWTTGGTTNSTKKRWGQLRFKMTNSFSIDEQGWLFCLTHSFANMSNALQPSKNQDKTKIQYS